MVVRAAGLLLVAAACACSGDAPARRGDQLACPRGTVHKGGYPLGEFCELVGSTRRSGPERHFVPGSRVVAQEWTWVDGERDGRYVSRWPNGTTKSSGEYRAGKYAGTWKDWNERGELIAERSYDDAGVAHGLALGYDGVAAIELECYEHGRITWTKQRWDGVGKPPPCPGPPPP